MTDEEKKEESQVEESLPPEVIMVPCGGGCGKTIHAPKKVAELMERSGTPPFCSDCREKVRKRVDDFRHGDEIHGKGTADGAAPIETELIIRHRPKSAPVAPGLQPGWMFRLTPGVEDQERSEMEVLMEFHLALLKYISQRQKKEGRPGQKSPRSILPVPKGMGRRAFEALMKATKKRSR